MMTGDDDFGALMVGAAITGVLVGVGAYGVAAFTALLLLAACIGQAATEIVKAIRERR